MTNVPTRGNSRIIFPIRITDNGRAVLEQFGVVFGEPAPWSDLHVYVTLPEGWQRVGYYIVDERGRYRVSISEKFAIYERYASASVQRRLRIQRDANYENFCVGGRVIVSDGDTVLYASTPILVADTHTSEFYEAEQQAIDAATAWCDEHRPAWRDPAAYWD